MRLREASALAWPSVFVSTISPRESSAPRAAFMYTLIVSCKMNDIDPQAWMADVLARLPDMPVSRVHELLPWNWKAELEAVKAA
jgi:transposase